MSTEKETEAVVLRDRIYAGWMGKNIGGTLGAPLEGVMELMEVTGYTQHFLEPVENDDLDLQLVALHCVEQYGGQVNANLLAQEWVSHVHFQYDEYGHALTNLRKGLKPPLGGAFNNFFVDCMGAPIRSELWAMLAAGNPALAAWFAQQDASVDHAGGEGMYGEIFFAVLECMALKSESLKELIPQALMYLPETCATRCCVEQMLYGYETGMTWKENRKSILEKFGTPNFTYAPPNIAFSLIGPLYGIGFTQQLLITACCGYDTDCTCATAAAILGMMHGTAYLDSQWMEPLGERIIVSRPITGIRPPRTIAELTERTLAARCLVEAVYGANDLPEQDNAVWVQRWMLPVGSVMHPDYCVSLRFADNTPAVAPEQEKLLFLELENAMEQDVQLSIAVEAPQGFDTEAVAGERFVLTGGERREFRCMLRAPREKRGSYEGHLVINTYYHGLFWKKDVVPLVLVPTLDWSVVADGSEQHVFCADNAIRLPQCTEAVLRTKLFLAQDCERRLKVCAVCPAALYVDGRQVFQNNQFTDAIPAYHRPTEKEWTGLLSAGEHDVEIRLCQAENAEMIYFYAVTPEETCFSADIHSVQGL